MRRIGALATRLVATAALGLSAAFGLTGCCYYELRDMCDECSLNVRNGYAARCAWGRCGGNYSNHSHLKPFRHGFLDGYSGVAGGADGCPPPLPPRCYWSCCTAGCEGPAIVNAYFDGYARGAVAAESDGVAGSGRLAYRKPACGIASVAPNLGAGPGPLVPMPGAGTSTLPSTAGPEAGVPSPPPPAPPSITPTRPSDEAYEGYGDGGLYYE